MSDKRAAIVLAAGKGKRMMSELPKVLHEIHGRPMISILLDTLIRLKFDKIVVVIGHKGEMVQDALKSYPVEFAWQREQHGTGHAVMMTKEQMGTFDGTTLVAAGDVPFLSESAINNLFDVHTRTKAVATCLSAIFPDPKGYGRIIRDGNSDRLKEIIEHKDATDEIRQIREVNSGTFCFDNQKLFEVINQIGNQNAQGEYYLTDAVKLLHNSGLVVSVVAAGVPGEVQGVNDIEQLKQLESLFGDRLR
jgi:bifunctional UDP-N-acetylglucosamine pyrophosphorylase/glucosamine-1-phosphate N-acetyltransferase